jgi:hypothetical protein
MSKEYVSKKYDKKVILVADPVKELEDIHLVLDYYVDKPWGNLVS